MKMLVLTLHQMKKNVPALTKGILIIFLLNTQKLIKL